MIYRIVAKAINLIFLHVVHAMWAMYYLIFPVPNPVQSISIAGEAATNSITVAWEAPVGQNYDGFIVAVSETRETF